MRYAHSAPIQFATARKKAGEVAGIMPAQNGELQDEYTVGLHRCASLQRRVRRALVAL
jgi:hypothetical protein